MSGVVVVAGVFEPGSVVTLFQVPDERVLRPGAEATEVGKRLTDGEGNVGWSGLEIGDRYLAQGYVNGNYVLVRAIGVDAEAPDSPLMQAPAQNIETRTGTQGALVVDPPPVVPETEQPLEVGVPEGVPTGIVQPETLYLHLSDGPIDAGSWEETGQQTPSEVNSDGSTQEPRALYRYRGDREPGEDWQAYEGAREVISPAAPVEPAPAEAEAAPVVEEPTTSIEVGDGVTVTPPATDAMGQPLEAPAEAAPEPVSDPSVAAEPASSAEPGAEAGSESGVGAEPAAASEAAPAPETSPTGAGEQPEPAGSDAGSTEPGTDAPPAETSPPAPAEGADNQVAP